MKRRINKWTLIGLCLAVALLVTLTVSPAYADECSDYGGITLDKAATFLSSMNDVRGVTYNPATNQLILIGHNNASLPAMNADDVAVAIRSVIGEQTNPSFTFGLPNTWHDGQDPATYFPQDLQNTHFGNVLFDSDRVLKILSLGRDNVNGQTVSPSVPGYKSLLNRYIDYLRANNAAPAPSATHRFWFNIGNMVLSQSPDGKSFEFSQATMLTSSQVLSGGDQFYARAAQDFADNLNANYDLYANQYPKLQELKQLAKITSVVKWIHDNNVPLDMTFWNQYQIKSANNPPGTYQSTPLETVSGSYTIGNTTWTINMTGGVDLSKANAYQTDSSVSALGQAAAASQPSEAPSSWTFTQNGTTYNAVALSLGPSLLPGACIEEAKDVSMPTRGALPLEFTRRYSSMTAAFAPTSMGYGWTDVPAQIIFPLDSYKATYTNGSGTNQTIYTQLTVNLGGQRELLVPNPAASLPTAIAFVPIDPKTHALDQKAHVMLLANADGTYTLEVDAFGYPGGAVLLHRAPHIHLYI